MGGVEGLRRPGGAVSGSGQRIRTGEGDRLARSRTRRRGGRALTCRPVASAAIPNWPFPSARNASAVIFAAVGKCRLTTASRSILLSAAAAMHKSSAALAGTVIAIRLSRNAESSVHRSSQCAAAAGRGGSDCCCVPLLLLRAAAPLLLTLLLLRAAVADAAGLLLRLLGLRGCEAELRAAPRAGGTAAVRGGGCSGGGLWRLHACRRCACSRNNLLGALDLALDLALDALTTLSRLHAGARLVRRGAEARLRWLYIRNASLFPIK